MASGIVIAGSDTDGIVLSNPATDDPATVAATASVTNNTATHNYDAVYGAPGHSWTVANLGAIQGVGPGAPTPPGAGDTGAHLDSSPGAGVHLTDGGVVNNGQHGSITGLIQGGVAGVNIEGGTGNVTNFGKIESSDSDFAAGVYLQGGGSVTNGESGSTGGQIIGGTGVSIGSGTGTVVNFGTIESNAGGYVVSGSGVSLLQGSVTNSVGGLITAIDTGVLISHGSSSVTNFGTISGGGVSVFLGGGGSVGNFGTIEGSIGVDFSGTASGTVENAGTIIGNGSTAVQFGGGDDRLTVDPGAVFVGRVDGAGGSDVLELAAGTGNKTLSGLGTNFVNFETVIFDANGNWTVALDNPMAFTGMISGFAKGDILDLTGTAATGASYAGGVLTVRNGATVVAALNLAGSYTSGDFSIGSDGHGGTNIGIAALTAINTPPVVIPTSTNVAATKGQVFAAASLFTASDADGDAIIRYDFWDTGGGGGHFTVKGMTQATGQEIRVDVADLAKTTYQSGSGTDTLWVRAFDGTQLSDWSSSFTVTGAGNTVPVVTPTGANLTATKGQSFAASSLFSASDTDGDAIMTYDFWDTGGGGGHFVVGNTPQPTGRDIYVDAANLAKVTYQSGSGTDTLWVRASDNGTQWSDWSSSFTVTGAGNTVPAVTPTGANLTATKGQSFAASSLFSASDADGDAIMTYDFWDTGGGGGHFVVGNTPQPTGRDIYVDAADLAKVTYQSGSGTDTLWVRASDNGTQWSDWSSSFTVTQAGDSLLNPGSVGDQTMLLAHS